MAGKGIFIIGAKRTPFCEYGGPLRELPASHIFAAAAKEAISSAKIDPTHIDNTIVGNVNFLSQCDGGKTPRYCGTYSGVPLNRPALGVNKACGTGLQAIISSAVEIITGSSEVTLTGGTELMSALPLFVRNIRFGANLGSSYYLEDHIKRIFPDSYTGLTLQDMAEELAKKYKVSREEVDQFALQSHLKWTAAQNAKIFDRELASVTATIKKKEVTVDKDQLPNTIDAEGLRKLPALLDNGEVVTSGNSSAPADGAAALILSGEEAIKTHGLRPLARVVGWACVGVDPVDTAISAVPAVKKLLKDQKLSVDDVDLFEINETFASQALITAMELKLDVVGKVNVNGGALAMGNPAAATGARMATHLVHELSRRNLKRGIAASSCGGGQGIAVLLETI